MSTSRDEIQHILTCADCRQFYKEMISEDREALKDDFRKIVKEEWLCSLKTIERVSRVEQIQSYIIVSVSTAWLAIIYLLSKTIFK